MKKGYILIALVILACLCVIGYIDYGDTIQDGLTNKKSKNSSFLTSEEWESQRPKDQIAIDVNFNPTMELTDEIRNATLEDLIIKDYIRFYELDEIQQLKEMLKQDRLTIEERLYLKRLTLSDVSLKFVSVNSNIAKIYFLQAPESFREHNSSYYNQCVEKVRQRLELEKKMQNMKNWSKYD